MQGVNYLPLVHLDGKLIGTYSSHTEDEDASSIGIGKNVGGVFLQRHYDFLGIWNTATTTSSLPLEIFVLPPAVVGNPTTTHSHDSADATTSAMTQQAMKKMMNMEEDWRLSPQLHNRNPHFDHPHDSFHSTKQKSPSLHQQPLHQQPQPKQEPPQGQGGDHNLTQSGAIMQYIADWD